MTTEKTEAVKALVAENHSLCYLPSCRLPMKLLAILSGVHSSQLCCPVLFPDSGLEVRAMDLARNEPVVFGRSI